MASYTQQSVPLRARIGRNHPRHLSQKQRKQPDGVPGDSPFLKLPLEIRLEIYGYLVVTPYGKIYNDFNHWPSSSERLCVLGLWYPLNDDFQPVTWGSRKRSLDLWILEVCKSVREECLGVLYKRNTLYVEPDIKAHDLQPSLEKWLSYENIQHLAIDFSNLRATTMPELAPTNNMLGTFVQGSKILKSCTLMITHDTLFQLLRSSKSFYSLPTCKSEWKDREDMLKQLEILKCCSQMLPSTTLKRLVLFSVGQNGANTPLQIEEIGGDPNCCIEEIHAAFGGELWFDGTLTYRSGNNLEIAFPSLCYFHNRLWIKNAIWAMQPRLDELDRITKEHLAMDKLFGKVLTAWKAFRDLDESGVASQEIDFDGITNDLSHIYGEYGEFIDSMGELSEEFNEMLSLEEPEFTEIELERKLESWGSVFDSKVVELPEMGDILTRTAGMITEWENAKYGGQ